MQAENTTPHRCIDCGIALVSRTKTHLRCQRCYHVVYEAEHKQERAAKDHAYYIANREKVAARKERYKATYAEREAPKKRAYYLEHRGAVLARHRAYYTANRTTLMASMQVWADANPEKKREYRHRRRAQIRAAFVGPVDFAAIWKRDRGLCHICGKAVDRLKATLDHLVPLVHHGTHEPKNVRIAHRSCNSGRRDRGPAQLLLFGE